MKRIGLIGGLGPESSIPLISIVEAICAFKKRGIVVLPEKEDKELINYKLFSEIELGIFKNETRELLIGIIDKMVKQQQIDSIIPGCTEFPLILTQETYAGVPVLNTTRTC